MNLEMVVCHRGDRTTSSTKTQRIIPSSAVGDPIFNIRMPKAACRMFVLQNPVSEKGCRTSVLPKSEKVFPKKIVSLVFEKF